MEVSVQISDEVGDRVEGVEKDSATGDEELDESDVGNEEDEVDEGVEVDEVVDGEILK